MIKYSLTCLIQLWNELDLVIKLETFVLDNECDFNYEYDFLTVWTRNVTYEIFRKFRRKQEDACKTVIWQAPVKNSGAPKSRTRSQSRTRGQI